MVNQMLTRWQVIATLEEPACAMADNAAIALDYISRILVDLELEGHLSRRTVNAACRTLGNLATSASQLRDTAYSLMEAPGTNEKQPAVFCEAVRDLSEELRIDWSLSALAEDAGRDEQIETRQRDRVQSALKALEDLVEGASQ